MAKSVFKKAISTFLIVLNFLVVVLYLMGCATPFFDISKYPISGFFGLIFPYLFVALAFSVFFWLIAKPKLALIPFITILFGWKQLGVLFAFNIKEDFILEKKANDIRIIDWNIRSFNGISKNREVKKHVREDVAETILKLNPDIICLQEFNTNHLNTSETDNVLLFGKTHPYFYFSKDYLRKNGNYQSGCIIFSKYPLADSGKIKYKPAESLIYADAIVGTDTIRIFNTHLQSFKFKKEDYEDIDKIKEQDEEALIASKNLYQKMKIAFKKRGIQANTVREALDKTNHAAIICGDFNDVPNSYTYFQIKNNWQDAFLQKGFGIGRSFLALASTLRIDYILADNRFSISQFDMVDEDLSDHTLLLTDLHLKK
jgi:endonuclease/exonuclease/phosphatase family metal-dependent hydrolase